MQENKYPRPKTPLKQKIALILFGFFLLFLLLEVSLRAGAFTLFYLQEYKNRQAIRDKGTYRIMCLGESTTAGHWPPILEEILNKRNIGIEFSVIDKGVGGIGSTGILEQLESNLNKYSPDIVVVMMGINDDLGIPYLFEDTPASKFKPFLRSLRIFKLARLLNLHIISGVREFRYYKSKENKQKHNLINSEINKEFQTSIFLMKKDPILATESALQEEGAYIARGKSLLDKGQLIEAELLFKKALELDSENDTACSYLGWCYLSQGKFRVAEFFYKKASEINHKKYVELGWFYSSEGQNLQAEEIFKKYIELDPQNERPHFELGKFYIDQSRFPEAEVSFKKALELNPRNIYAHTGLGWSYMEQNRFPEAELSFKKALELSPKEGNAYSGLGWSYMEQNRFFEAEASFKKAAQLNLNSFRELSLLYDKMNKSEFSRRYSRKADMMGLRMFSPIARKNYLRLKDILDERKIKLVCVQYPVRNIMPLKKIFGDKKESIIFVDNERIFRDVLRTGSYRDYFVDRFAVDFGHCTPKGNRLLAENIAHAILKEIFHK